MSLSKIISEFYELGQRAAMRNTYEAVLENFRKQIMTAEDPNRAEAFLNEYKNLIRRGMDLFAPAEYTELVKQGERAYSSRQNAKDN